MSVNVILIKVYITVQQQKVVWDVRLRWLTAKPARVVSLLQLAQPALPGFMFLAEVVLLVLLYAQVVIPLFASNVLPLSTFLVQIVSVMLHFSYS